MGTKEGFLLVVSIIWALGALELSNQLGELPSSLCTLSFLSHKLAREPLCPTGWGLALLCGVPCQQPPPLWGHSGKWSLPAPCPALPLSGWLAGAGTEAGPI